ncbi:MAG TPA: hypothetical protein VNN08_13145 [Thermoanaerobaculia bacterium]|nr:hypothetical protein [Thermoanaerobaculia bacterium]
MFLQFRFSRCLSSLSMVALTWAPLLSAEVHAGPARGTAAGIACLATTAGELVACSNAVQSGTYSIIEIQGDIVCSGVDACRVHINDRPVAIRGDAGATIRRIDHHDYPLIQIIGSLAAEISSLTIDEDADVACTPVTPTNPPVDNPACSRTIDIFGVADVVLDHVTIAASKSIGAFFNTCGSARVSHARFIAPYQFGLEITGLTGGLTIEDTLFWHASSNALVLFDVHGTAQAPLVLRRSLFDHNHRDDVYYTCGPGGHEKCAGGQLLLAGKVDFLRVENTVMRQGFDDLDSNAVVDGVEINQPGIHDVTFASDDVHTNTSWGVGLNSDPIDVARISFVNDKLYDNGKDPRYLGVDIGNFPPGIESETGSCHTADCAAVPFGALWSLPGGAVSWTTNDVAAPRVTVNGVLVSTAPVGQITAPQNASIVLYDGLVTLDVLGQGSVARRRAVRH